MRCTKRSPGVRGVFDTRIAYVTAKGIGNNATYALMVGDSDGYGPQQVVTLRQPLLSPAWSPDGRKLAYESFERGSSAIYIQDIGTGAREVVVRAQGHQWRAGVLARRPQARAEPVERRQSGHLRHGSRQPRADPDHAQLRDRHRTGLVARWQHDLFHLRPRRQTADLLRSPPAAAASRA